MFADAEDASCFIVISNAFCCVIISPLASLVPTNDCLAESIPITTLLNAFPRSDPERLDIFLVRFLNIAFTAVPLSTIFENPVSVIAANAWFAISDAFIIA